MPPSIFPRTPFDAFNSVDGASRAVLPSRRSQSRLRYHSHVERDGKALYQLTCERNLEGIVAKRRDGLYDTRKPQGVKVKNPNYTQAAGRVELFEELRS